MKNRFARQWLIAGTILAAMAIAGCGSPQVHEVSEEKSITTERLDIQNFNRAATELTNKMLTSPRVQEELDRISRESGGKRPYVEISRIRNDTGLKINMVDYLVSPIEEAFINSGRLDFFSDDKKAQSLGAANDMLNGTQARLPNLVLNGSVSRLSTGDGNMRQQTYSFRLQLVDPAGGNTFFVGSSSPIIKQVKGQGIGL